MKGYAHMARALTNRLKEDSFVWNIEAEHFFQMLKAAMTQVPVLAMPDFLKPFVVENDASHHWLSLIHI